MLLAIDTSSYHPATKLALAAIFWLDDNIKNCNLANPANIPVNILDIGCGNGILSITAYDLWKSNVLACDISQNALKDAAGFIRDYAPESTIKLINSDGFSHPEIRKTAPYDLIMANLIAKWQIKMASDIEKSLNKGGIAMLSGILIWQQEAVEAAIYAANLHIIQRFGEGNWRCFLAIKE